MKDPAKAPGFLRPRHDLVTKSEHQDCNQMNRIFAVLAVAVGLQLGAANAQDPHATYEIGNQKYGLFGYYVSQGNRPHFLAVFRPSAEQSQDPDQFSYQAACEAIVASPPDIAGIPKIVPTGGVVFFQVVKRRMLLLSTNVSSYLEFDVDEGGCSKAEPASIYTPVPGFTPGISNRVSAR